MLKAVKKTRAPTQEKPAQDFPYTPEGMLEELNRLTGITAIAMDSTGMWHAAVGKFAQLDSTKGWYHPGFFCAIKRGLLPILPDWKKAHFFIDGAKY